MCIFTLSLSATGDGTQDLVLDKPKRKQIIYDLLRHLYLLLGHLNLIHCVLASPFLLTSMTLTLMGPFLMLKRADFSWELNTAISGSVPSYIPVFFSYNYFYWFLPWCLQYCPTVTSPHNTLLWELSSEHHTSWPTAHLFIIVFGLQVFPSWSSASMSFSPNLWNSP